MLAAESLLSVLPRERIAGVHAFAADAGFSLVAEQAQGLPLLAAGPEHLLSARPDLVLVDDASGDRLASQRADRTTEIAIRGADDRDDTLTVDLDGWPDLPITFDGGAGALL